MEYKNRITSETTDKLEKNQIFVFGSNESGFHGGGAAYMARHKFGAQIGVGFGRTGYSFAIPTKDWKIDTLGLLEIEFYVKRFIEYVKIMPQDIVYLVTQIGCGLAGYSPKEIAPFFKECINMENIHLPEPFWQILLENESTESNS